MTTLGAAIDRRRRLALAPALAAHLACAAAEGPAPAAPPKSDATPPPFVPAPHHALTFESRNVGCRDLPLASYRGRATLDVDERGATLEVVASADDPFAGLELQGAPPRPTTPAPLRCRWRGPGEAIDGEYRLQLRSEAIDEGCGDEAPFELRCRPERLELADASGTIAAADVTICAVTEPHPSILWVLLAGGAIVLGDDALRSELELAGLGGAHQRLVRGPTP
ncbi:MAG: hypothetical protein H6711_33615 [Myxococcales bacterium]|nr:hypothetical protein [Myxococcales bacterium]